MWFVFLALALLVGGVGFAAGLGVPWRSEVTFRVAGVLGIVSGVLTGLSLITLAGAGYLAVLPAAFACGLFGGWAWASDRAIERSRG